MLPSYILFGMSPEEYWDGDPKLATAYRESYELYKQQQNQMMWMQGLYNYEAYSISLENAFRKKGTKAKSYPAEPHRITPMSEKEKETKKDLIVDDFRTKLDYLAKHFLGGDKNDG